MLALLVVAVVPPVGDADYPAQPCSGSFASLVWKSLGGSVWLEQGAT